MLLKKIELENVKTHKKTVIPFKKGLNVFHGDNGTGKSTVLEMIGFILFDYLEGRSHSDYVRDVSTDKPDYGIVKLWIIGLNNEPYLIERKIGKSEIEVYHGLTKRKLTRIEKISQLKNWIENQIGISGGIELDKLFKTSIGIPQGTFIDPFQREPRERKDYFDPILNLKIYEEIWKELGRFKKEIYDTELQGLREKISELGGELKNKSILEVKIDKLDQEIDNIRIELERRKKLGKILNEKLEKLNFLKDRIKASQEEREKLKIKKKNAQTREEELLISLNQAQEAQKICQETKNSYEQYEIQLNQQKKLQGGLSELQEKQSQLQDLKSDHLKIENEIENIKSQIEKVNEARENSRKLEKKYERYKEIEAILLKINEELTRYKTLEEELNKKQAKVNNLELQVEGFNKRKKMHSQLEERYIKLEKRVLELEEKNSKIADLMKEISFIDENNRYLLEGKCPFFEQTCKNIEAKVADPQTLLKVLETKKSNLELYKNEVNKLENDLKVKIEIESKIQEFNEEQIRIKEIQKQIEKLNTEIKEEIQSLKSISDISAKKVKLESEREKLESYVNNYIKYTEISKDSLELRKKIEPLNLELTKKEEKIKKFENELKKLQRIPYLLKEINESISKLKPDYDKYQTHIKQAERVHSLEDDYKDCQSSLKTFERQLQDIKEQLSDLESKYDEHDRQQCENDYKKYEERKTELLTRIKEKQSNLDEFRKEYKSLKRLEGNLKKLKEDKDVLDVQRIYIGKLRNWIREFIPKMRSALINKINITASEIYRSIREDDEAILKWRDDYDIEIATSKTVKNFFRLSGGEKMSAALAVRLAILKVLTNANFAFFDEPTTNLDETTRKNLSRYIYNIKGFEQLFVISHDDSFKLHSEYVIKFTKDSNETTHIDYITKGPHD
jgi:exonuclease SbcC